MDRHPTTDETEQSLFGRFTQLEQLPVPPARLRIRPVAKAPRVRAPLTALIVVATIVLVATATASFDEMRAGVGRPGPTRGDLLIVVAGPRDGATVQVLDLAQRRVRGEFEVGPNATVMWDSSGQRFVVQSEDPIVSRTSHVLVIDRPTLAVRRTLAITDIHQTRPPGVSPVILTAGGRLVVAARLEFLGPDTSVPFPGAQKTRETIAGWDASSGEIVGSVTLDHCGPPSLRSSSDPGLVWVTCFGASELRAVDIRSWKVARTIALPPNLYQGQTVVAAERISSDGRHYVAVTHDLRIVRVDLQTGETTIDSHWTSSREGVLFHQISLSSDGARIWILTGSTHLISTLEAERVTLLNLQTGARRDTSVPGVRLLAGAGDDVVYATLMKVHNQAGDVLLELATKGSRLEIMTAP